MVRRAGGHVDHGDGRGWVLDDEPAPPAPEPQPHKPFPPPVQAAGGWVLSPPAEPAPAVIEELVKEESDDEPETASDSEIRAWAREAGLDVPARGRLSKEIVDQYLSRET